MSKKIARNFYFISLLLNVVFPLVVAKIIVGNKTGEVMLMYFFAIIWAIVCLLVYTIYFTIPDYQKEWERVATFMFPSFFIGIGMFIEFQLFIIPFVLNVIFNISCLLYYKQAMKKVT